MAKVYKRYNLLIQLVILVVSYVFIINQVFWKHDLPAMIKFLGDDLSSPRFLGMLAVLFALMILNWFLEAVKWRRLISKVEAVSLWQSIVAVLTGVTISTFTPNRVGEFFGRAFILKKASHVEGILITVLGSMSQLLVTVITGSLSFLVVLTLLMPGGGFSGTWLFYSFAVVVIVFDSMLLGLFFNLPFLASIKEKILINGLSRIHKYLRVFAMYSNRELLMVMGLSFARYLVFSTQYLLLLSILGVNVPWYYQYILIALIYFIMAIIPTIALTEIGIRGSVAIYCIGLYFTSMTKAPQGLNLGILIASTLIWFINLGIPAIAGSFFLFRLQFFRNNIA